MSNAVSALNGKLAAGEVTIREAGLRGMITLRGDLAFSKLKSICTGLTGVDFPASGQANCVGDKGLCWMSPDEILILVPYTEVGAALDIIARGMKKKHHLAENVSDARALITVEGAYAREVIAKLAPVDLHPDAFQPGSFRRSHLGQAAAAFWMRDADTIELICFRSVAEYVFDLLADAAKAGPVGLLA